MSAVPLARRAAAEFAGTAMLAAVVAGLGIMATRLSPGDTGLELLENSLATAIGLAVIILVVAPVSGVHLNPVISVADWALGRRSGTGVPGRALAAHLPAPIRDAIAARVRGLLAELTRDSTG